MKKLIIFLITFATLTACHRRPASSDTAPPFCLSDTMQHKIQLADVIIKPVQNVITLTGKLEANEDKWVKVFPVVDGVVEKLNVQLGDYVQKGQVLAEVHSGNIADFQNQVSYTKSNISTAEKNLQSLEEMFKAGLATEKDVTVARNELEKARADHERANQVSGIYGAKNNAIQSIKSPISGFIVEKNVTDHMQYQSAGAQPFFVIANLDEIWVMANVFESDVQKIKEGYDADINVAALKDKIFHGKVDRIFNILDPQSGVMKIRIRIPNPGFELKPQMFAQINIHYDDGGQQMPAIPSEAVIFDRDKNYVMVYTDKCHIETREIEIFRTNGETSYIKSGLKAGEKIISQYQLLVYDALND